MRWIVIGILFAGLSGLALAQDDPRQDKVNAATDCAVSSLLEQIEPQTIVGQLTVKDFLDRTGGEDEFRAALARSGPVGGARWLDDQTCQVRLEVAGTEIVADLANIAVKHAAQSPIAAGDLPRVADGLSLRWFAATGTSTAAGVAPPPPVDSPWMAVPPELRRQAVQSADADAAQNVLASVASVELTPGQTLGQAMSAPPVRQSLTDWLTSRPVTAVEYSQDAQKQLIVRVTLAANSSDLFDILRASVTARNDVAFPADPAGWAVVRNQLIHEMTAAVGSAAAPAATTLPVALPTQPPDWINLMADAAGSSGAGASPLRAARAAQADAMARLRQQVMDLHLSPNLTIGQAVKQDRHLARVVDRAILGAQLYKTEYNPDGTVIAHMSLDLRLVWAAMDNP